MTQPRILDSVDSPRAIIDSNLHRQKAMRHDLVLSFCRPQKTGKARFSFDNLPSQRASRRKLSIMPKPFTRNTREEDLSIQGVTLHLDALL